MKVVLFIYGLVVIFCFWPLFGAIGEAYTNQVVAVVMASVGGGASFGIWTYYVWIRRTGS